MSGLTKAEIERVFAEADRAMEALRRDYRDISCRGEPRMDAAGVLDVDLGVNGLGIQVGDGPTVLTRAGNQVVLFVEGTDRLTEDAEEELCAARLRTREGGG